MAQAALKIDSENYATQFLRTVYGSFFTEKPKGRSDRELDHNYTEKNFAWAHIGVTEGPDSKDIVSKVAVRTYSSLDKYIERNDSIFVTPNLFLSRREKSEVMLQYMTAVVLDYDQGKDEIELLEKLAEAKLPAPTMINETSKGLHLWFVLADPVRATKNNQTRYKRIVKAMCTLLGTDAHCMSPSHFFRIPKAIIFEQPQNRFDFMELYDFSKKYLKENTLNTAVRSYGKNLFEESATAKLLEGVGNGNRNLAAYALARVCRYMAMSQDECLEYLTAWNYKNTPPLAPRELFGKVKSAYSKSNSTHLPLNSILNITGESISMRSAFRKHAKAREDRKISHLYEYAADIEAFLKSEGGIWRGTQKELVSRLNIPERSLKAVIRQIKEGKVSDVTCRIFGAGRGAQTELRIVDKNKKQRESRKIGNVVFVDFAGKETVHTANKYGSTPLVGGLNHDSSAGIPSDFSSVVCCGPTGGLGGSLLSPNSRSPQPPAFCEFQDIPERKEMVAIWYPRPPQSEPKADDTDPD